MPKQGRIKTKYPGVYYIVKGKEKIFYIYYRSNGRQIEEKAGRQYAADMSPAKAAGIRADRSKGKEPSNKTRREQIKAAKEAEAGKITLLDCGMSMKHKGQIVGDGEMTRDFFRNT